MPEFLELANRTLNVALLLKIQGDSVQIHGRNNMSTGSWRIKSSEIERTLKSIRSVGLHIRSIELAADGTIKVTVADAETGECVPETPEQLRKLL